jgi:hypothetical protein
VFQIQKQLADQPYMHGVENQIVIVFAKSYHNVNVTQISKMQPVLAVLIQNVLEVKFLMFQVVNVNVQTLKLVSVE